MAAQKQSQDPHIAEYVECLETAAPAWFTPTSIDEMKKFLAILIREHVRACYRTQEEAGRALGTTQGRVSQIVNGSLSNVKVDALLRMAFAAGLIKRVEVAVE